MNAFAQRACLLAAGLFLLATGCSYAPDYTGTYCGPEGACPPGLVCLDGQCFPDGERPRPDEVASGEPGDGDQDDTDAGADPGADTGADSGEDAGADPGEDAGVDAGADTGADPGADPGSADAGPCGHNCPDGSYCDPVSEQCAPCTNEGHCGPDCIACDEQAHCVEMDGTHCCVPDCTTGNVCQQVVCGGTTYVCKVIGYDPVTVAWHPVSSEQPHRCRLTQDEGPLPDTRCWDERNLWFNCPWDGKCEEGICVVDPNVERLYDCTEPFGCAGDTSSGQCRRHKQVGASCRYNYDCTSFCCQRTDAATCIPFDGTQCKLVRSYYLEGIQDYIWTAWSQDDPHDIQSWSWSHGVPDATCSHDWECDSGRCGGFMKSDKCALPDCLEDTEASTIKSGYFCKTGDHDLHIIQVTNQNPFPPDDRCQ